MSGTPMTSNEKALTDSQLRQLSRYFSAAGVTGRPTIEQLAAALAEIHDDEARTRRTSPACAEPARRRKSLA